MAPLHPVRFELIPFSSSSVKTVQKKGVGKQYSMQKSDGLGGRFFFFVAEMWTAWSFHNISEVICNSRQSILDCMQSQRRVKQIEPVIFSFKRCSALETSILQATIYEK